MPHLKAGNSEAAGVVRRSDDRHEVGAVGYVLVVELHRDLVVTWRRARRERDSEGERQQTNVRRTQPCVCVRAFAVPGSWATYETPQDPSLRSSKEISALLGPSTAMARPPAPASLVQMLNSAGK